ncbi:NAD(P)-dependent oxidoreductase [Burkholderia gladioli]|uniref:NAD-dependent epimerase/dehydratase family protein n=1 Tax=Burkholderia gladioli TaxID=28095 RepID=UPI000CDB8406|nr:NAD(P)-dependent oxidoreductase [Burkholderia gladioli]POS05673.1 NAD(P)-dependent oxidoreductase [Burkholderia gladioli]
MRVLLTGGAGFVGLNLAQRLLSSGATVVCFGPVAPVAAASACFASLPGRWVIEPGDVRDAGRIAELIGCHGVTHVVHGAAITAGLEREARQAADIAEVNLVGTLNVLQAARRASLARVIVLGSGAVFGAAGIGPSRLREDEIVPRPESLYGITKQAAESAAVRFRQSHGLDVAVARLGVVFGPWEHDTEVRDTLSLPFLLNRMAQAGETARLGRGTPDDWIHAGEAAEAVTRLLEAASLRHALYHVGSGRRWSLAAWCEQLRRHYPAFTYEIGVDPARVNLGGSAPAARAPLDVTRLRDQTGFAAAHDEASACASYQAWRARMRVGFGDAAAIF